MKIRSIQRLGQNNQIADDEQRRKESDHNSSGELKSGIPDLVWKKKAYKSFIPAYIEFCPYGNFFGDFHRLQWDLV